MVPGPVERRLLLGVNETVRDRLLAVVVRRRVTELKAAAAQIEDVPLACRGPRGVRQRVAVLASQFLDFHQAGLAQDAQMLRHVLLRYLETIGDLPYVQRMIDQQADDPDARFLAERLERNDTIV